MHNHWNLPDAEIITGHADGELLTARIMGGQLPRWSWIPQPLSKWLMRFSWFRTKQIFVKLNEEPVAGSWVVMHYTITHGNASGSNNKED